MLKTVSAEIGNSDFHFENSLVRIIANRNFPEIKLAGLNVGSFEEGNEYQVYHWIAQELERSGIAHFPEEDCMDSAKLYKIQWKERAQTIGQMSKLQDDFYPRLRRHLVGLKEEIAKNPEKMLECEKIRHLTRDIVNSRLKKIVSLASAPAQTEQILKNLTNEEKFLYAQLYKCINEWRTRILEYRENAE